MTNYAALVARLDGAGEAVIWDKDSTLAHTAHRQPIIAQIRAGEATWEDFSAACAEDLPMPGPVALMRLLPLTHIVVSGATESAREAVEMWGVRYDIPWHHLILRPADCRDRNPRYKAEVVKAIQRLGISVQLCVEDDERVAAELEALGVPVLVVNPRYPGPNPESMGNVVVPSSDPEAAP